MVVPARVGIAFRVMESARNKRAAVVRPDSVMRRTCYSRSEYLRGNCRCEVFMGRKERKELSKIRLNEMNMYD